MLTEANGLLYMRARYYSPDMMRFINEDIVTGDISNSNSLNRYSYVEGNPVTMVDPFGLCAQKSGQTNFQSPFEKEGSSDLVYVFYISGKKGFKMQAKAQIRKEEKIESGSMLYITFKK